MSASSVCCAASSATRGSSNRVPSIAKPIALAANGCISFSTSSVFSCYDNYGAQTLDRKQSRRWH